jgi:hypothetical protein
VVDEDESVIVSIAMLRAGVDSVDEEAYVPGGVSEEDGVVERLGKGVVSLAGEESVIISVLVSSTCIVVEETLASVGDLLVLSVLALSVDGDIVVEEIVVESSSEFPGADVVSETSDVVTDSVVVFGESFGEE